MAQKYVLGKVTIDELNEKIKKAEDAGEDRKINQLQEHVIYFNNDIFNGVIYIIRKNRLQ